MNKNVELLILEFECLNLKEILKMKKKKLIFLKDLHLILIYLQGCNKLNHNLY